MGPRKPKENQWYSLNLFAPSKNMIINISKRERKHEQENITSIALTKYSDRTDIQAVIIKSQVIDSHLEISGASSSSKASSFRLPSWVDDMHHTTNQWIEHSKFNCYNTK